MKYHSTFFLVLIGILMSLKCYSQQAFVSIESVKFSNDCEEICIELNKSTTDSITIDELCFLFGSNKFETENYHIGKTTKFRNRYEQYVYWDYAKDKINPANTPFDIKIVYRKDSTIYQAFYSSEKLKRKVKKPIEERNSYLALHMGYANLWGNNDNLSDKNLTDSELSMYARWEFGKKIIPNTFLTVSISSFEIQSKNELSYNFYESYLQYNRWQIDGLMLGLRYDKSFSKFIVSGHTNIGYSMVNAGTYTSSSIRSEYIYTKSPDWTLSYSVELGLGYNLNRCIRVNANCFFTHLNAELPKANQSISGFCANVGLSFFFNNQK